MTQKYIKVEIKSEADLPKEGQKCLCHLIMDDEVIETAIFSKARTESWFKYVDWYLIEEDQPTNESKARIYNSPILNEILSEITPEEMDATLKEMVAESIEHIFKNTERIHGKSDAIDWIKVASHKSATFLSECKRDKLPTEEEMDIEAINYGRLVKENIDGNNQDYGVAENASLDFLRGANWYKNQLRIK